MITKEMTIDEIFEKFPEKSQKLAHAMEEFGLHCAGCCASSWETIEAGVLGHDKSEEELEELLKKLNAILQEKLDPSTISITEKAAKKFKEICESDNKAGYHLRFGDRPAGCSGFEYTLDFSKEAKESDLIYHSNGLQIHVDKDMAERLVGCVIDYSDSLQGGGFKISNPNAKTSCGCGSSHGY